MKKQTEELGTPVMIHNMEPDKWTKLGWFLAGVIVGAMVTAVAFKLATPVRAVAENKVTICHRTDSDSNPYVVNTPNKSGNVDGHDNHNGPVWFKGIEGKWGDIIPPFDYFDNHGHLQHYPGKNWTTSGQAIWDNGCVPPPPPTHYACVEKACKKVDGAGDNSCESDKDCQPKPVDQCINLSGFQETVPANMQTNADHVCSCLTGFHEVPVEDSKDFTCVADQTPPPPPPSNNNSGGGSAPDLSPAAFGLPSCNGDYPNAPIIYGFQEVSSSEVKFLWHKSVTNPVDYQIVQYGFKDYGGDTNAWPYGVPKVDSSAEEINLANLGPHNQTWARVGAVKGECVAWSKSFDP